MFPACQKKFKKDFLFSQIFTLQATAVPTISV
jgi:hypothetical protein